MQTQHHRFAELFAQLGLPSSPESIAAFVSRHAPLPRSVSLADAPFWTPTQATLLRESLHDDADWAELVDHLDASLRSEGAAR